MRNIIPAKVLEQNTGFFGALRMTTVVVPMATVCLFECRQLYCLRSRLLESLVFCEGGDAGEGFAFEEFEAGTAAGRDMGDAVGDAGLLDGSD